MNRAMGGLRPWRGPLAFAAMLAGLSLGMAALTAGAGLAFAEIATQWDRYQAYKSLQAGAGTADSLSSAYAGIQKDLRALRAALPGGNPGAQVLDRLVAGAKACSLSIAGITALDEIPFPAYRELPYEMEVGGGFKDLVRYLHDLETGGVALQVRTLSIRSEGMNKARIKAKLGLSALAPASAPGQASGGGAPVPAAMDSASGEAP
jgi:hypothetical protein